MIKNSVYVSYVKIDCRVRTTFDKTMHFEIDISRDFDE